MEPESVRDEDKKFSYPGAWLVAVLLGSRLSRGFSNALLARLATAAVPTSKTRG